MHVATFNPKIINIILPHPIKQKQMEGVYIYGLGPIHFIVSDMQLPFPLAYLPNG